jgi:GNAT superfamily N-acetyltransferase
MVLLPGTVGEEVAIGSLSAADLTQAIQWSEDGEDFSGRHDAECFLLAGGQGFRGLFVQERLVAAGWVVAYDERYAFFGGLSVAPDFRGRGLGPFLVRALSEYARGRTVGVEAPLNRKAACRRVGFRTAHTTTRFAGVAAGETRPAVVALQRVPFKKLVEYDSLQFPARRSEFLKRWTTQPESVALAKMNRGRMLGYAVMRPCPFGHRIGPLFADDSAVAEDLFQTCAARANGKPVVLDVPDSNQDAQTLAEQHCLAPLRRTVRMYAGELPRQQDEHIYSVTAPELG